MVVDLFAASTVTRAAPIFGYLSIGGAARTSDTKHDITPKGLRYYPVHLGSSRVSMLKGWKCLDALTQIRPMVIGELL